MDALGEYTSRESAARKLQAALEKRSRSIGNARLAVAVAFLALGWLVFSRQWNAWFLVAPISVFICLLLWHSRLRRLNDRATRVADWYAAGVARLNDNWMGAGANGARFLDQLHPYAHDIDLFGHGSLFQLLSQARTTIGEAALAEWLLHPSSAAEVEQRHKAVQELATPLDLREDVALIGATHQISDPSRLVAWSTAPLAAIPKFARTIGVALALAGVALAIVVIQGRAPLFAFAVVFAGSVSFAVWLRHPLAQALSGFETSSADLESLSLILKRLERERFQSPKLSQVRAALDAGATPASKRIARLRRWIELFDSTDHILLRIVNPVILLRQQFALGIVSWRRENARHIPSWLQAVAEFEALSSLATLAHERPHWRFPVLAASTEPLFRARSLSHPLIPAKRAVPNDVELSNASRLLIISGSNMSGKSTLLRSVGIAAVLAFAGAPVPADELTITPLQLGASLRTNDSLQDNRSRFMAELLRLRQIVELTRADIPVLFLLDELLSGTNSHDRRIGASAIVRGLIDSGAIGALTTHDLALTAIADELAGMASNAHFTDEIVQGELHFDYRLRPGVVTHSNALELMRMIGLLPNT